MKRKILISLCAAFILCGAQAQKLLDAASGMYHTLLLFEDGKILAFGYNSYGQLGLGFESGHADSIYEPLPSSCEPPAYVDSPVKFVSVAAGETHSLAIARDGTLWGWGCNGSGQLGNCIAWYKEKKSRAECGFPTYSAQSGQGLGKSVCGRRFFVRAKKRRNSM